MTATTATTGTVTIAQLAADWKRAWAEALATGECTYGEFVTAMAKTPR